MTTKIFRNALTVLFCALLWACNDEPEPLVPEPVGPDNPQPEQPTEPEKPSEPEIKNPRTVLLYIVADNSLGRGDYDSDDLREIHLALADKPIDGRLVVYHSRPGTDTGTHPVLYEIVSSDATQDVELKAYPDDLSVYSTDESRMREVLDDVRQLAPARDYGIIFWSHATGWRSEEGQAKSPMMRSFGDDRRHRMKITTMARTLRGYDNSFIYFDCCLMATAEVFYELRDCAKIIAASGAEVHAEGMPYNITLPYFFTEGEADIEGVARATFEYYDARTGNDRWSTQTVVETSRLNDFADATAALMSRNVTPPANTTSVQSYSPTRSYRIFDMEDYLEQSDGIAPEQLKTWRSALSSAIIYKAATPKVNGSHSIRHYCGMGCNIVTDPEDAFVSGYNELAWWRDVVSRNPFYQK